ncbi:hypothetical protein ACIOUG_14660 [Pseudomonas sp. NPDC087803]|uniref:hypothetical protein n=1 Tax=Pseudomonas sp. NPDC087803 TaxID=3364448 RepID=UPI0037F32812
MKPFILPPRFSRAGHLVALLLVLFAPAAEALTQQISASFRPDSANPQNNRFTNTTPVSGYCEQHPTACRDNNIFSIRLPLRFDSVRALQPDADARNSAMFKLPTEWRLLSVTNTETGETEQVEVRIAGFGSDQLLSHSTVDLTGAPDIRQGHDQLWHGSGWLFAAPPCQYSGLVTYTSRTYSFFWKTPSEGTCVKVARFVVPAMSYQYLDFAYELRTPNPLGMSSGVYNGQLSYRIGPGGDFDMGDVMLPSDSTLTLDFALDVQHTLKVEVPPGGDQVQLVPAGGWQSWLQAGRRPVSLFRDQIFNISASSRFKMQLECETPGIVTDCVLRSRTTDGMVELHVFLSLPNGLTDLSGQPVKRRRLRTGAANAQYFQPGFYVDRAPGTLHFEIPAYAMEFLLLPGLGGAYSGRVTVIWDSDV